MRLLFVLPEYLPQQGGGLITFYRHLLPDLASRGHHVEVLMGSAFTHGDLDRMLEGVRVRLLPTAALEAARKQYQSFAATPELAAHLAAARALWEVARGGEGFDCVETTDWGLLFLPWVTTPGPATLVQLHGSIGQIAAHDPVRGGELGAAFTQLVEGAGLASALELHTYSQANASYWQRRLAREVCTILPAWPLSPMAPGGRTDGPGLVVARIQRWKGPDTVCEALRILGAQAPVVAWVGRDTVDGTTGGSYAAFLARRFPHVWGRLVRPLGPRSFAETDELRHSAAFAIVPSTWDVFNFTVVEGMAAALPVICSTGAGAAELIEDGVSGFTFPAGDAVALAERIRQVRGMSVEEREAMGTAARETVRRRLDPNENLVRRLERYAALAEGSLRPAARAPAWLVDVVAPRPPLHDPLAFLHLLPLRGLLRHVLARLSGKLARR